MIDMKPIDRRNVRYGSLVAIERDCNASDGQACWRCKCDCGNEVVVKGGNLQSGNTSSCGCAHRRRGTDHPNTTHGKRHSAEYVAWANMKTRCLNTRSASYRDYGGRGIVICERWINSFENFLADMGERPVGRTLERKNVNGNYEPGNCVWATMEQQARNRRTTRVGMDDAASIRRMVAGGMAKRAVARDLRIARASVRAATRHRGTG